MIVTMSRQDLQSAVEYAKNAIIQRMITKEDLNRACFAASDRIIDDLQDVRKANLPYIKQNIVLTEQLHRRAQNIETRIGVMEQEVRNMAQVMNRMLGQQAQTINGLARY